MGDEVHASKKVARQSFELNECEAHQTQDGSGRGPSFAIGDRLVASVLEPPCLKSLDVRSRSIPAGRGLAPEDQRCASVESSTRASAPPSNRTAPSPLNREFLRALHAAYEPVRQRSGLSPCKNRQDARRDTTLLKGFAAACQSPSQRYDFIWLSGSIRCAAGRQA